ncbi:MAG: hypothetical protein QI223_10040 [Candidatus Korarchaeota archaeon]|nr:hypothetical protein [Candidatus Korarchaeota archaeon]
MGEIVELTRGVYTFKRSPYMVVKALPMSYVGLGSAALIHGASTQVTALTVLSPLVSAAVRGGERVVCGYKVLLRRISPKMYFGYDLVRLREIDEWIRVSTPEKTLIDAIYLRYPLLDEIAPGLLRMTDERRLRGYLETMRERGVKGARRVEAALRGVGLEIETR